MSFLSVLGNIGKTAAGFIPGIGPALSAGLGAIGNVTSGAAQGAAEGRRADAGSMVGTQLANLQTQNFAADEQDRAFKRMMLQNLLGGVGDVSIGRPPGSTIPTFNITGGLRPSALGDRSNLIAELGKAGPKVPEMLDLPKQGIGEKILGGVGLGTSILGALGQLGRQPNRPGGPYATPPFVPGNQSMPMPLPPGYR